MVQGEIERDKVEAKVHYFVASNGEVSEVQLWSISNRDAIVSTGNGYSRHSARSLCVPVRVCVCVP